MLNVDIYVFYDFYENTNFVSILSNSTYLNNCYYRLISKSANLNPDGKTKIENS